MNDLSKQQLILLALLVSFVTSLFTGIVTVSLMDQAPQGITRTITQVIQKTVATAVPTDNNPASVSIAVDDQVADATDAVTPSIVRLRDGDTGPVVALGLIVSPTGTLMTDKSIIDGLNYPEAVFPDGHASPITVTRFQIEGDIAFLSPAIPLTSPAKPISFSGAARLGSSIWSLTGTSTYVLSQGIVRELDPMASSSSSFIHTTIPEKKVLPGAPLFDATGSIVGIETDSLSDASGATFYPIRAAKDAVPN